MTKTIDTLVEDIYSLVTNKKESDGTSHGFIVDTTNFLFRGEDKVRPSNTLYFSEVGDPCLRRLWYKYNSKEHRETPNPNVLIKFQYGNIVETLAYNLAAYADHTVENVQKKVVYNIPGTDWKVTGRLDCTIDGVVVDVKSVNSRSISKFVDGLRDDPFGYYQQLNGYAVAEGSEQAGFLTVDKDFGHINYFPIVVDKYSFELTAQTAAKAVQLPTPDKLGRFDPVDASYGNKKLCVACSYCDFKKECWKDSNGGAGLATYIYSSGPVYLVEVKTEPKVKKVEE